jgi:hypothetical protein
MTFYSDGRARRYQNIHKTQGPGSYSRDWVNLTPRSIEGDWGSGFPVRYGPLTIKPQSVKVS